ncbi:hypothetical protein [Longirhabdus pacifica]|uniref:hypothetical protein n=1 Tax=Longirhabdus pacifica TaxID=2305227 RepID=UPI001008F761|nr:hypothetical protein [Longirhabdus pacifica]
MQFEAYDIALLPVIIGLVSIAKTLGIPQKYASLVAIGLGIPCGMFYIAPNHVGEGVLVGVTLGLAASGLYSTTKNIVQQK